MWKIRDGGSSVPGTASLLGSLQQCDHGDRHPESSSAEDKVGTAGEPVESLQRFLPFNVHGDGTSTDESEKSVFGLRSSGINMH